MTAALVLLCALSARAGVVAPAESALAPLAPVVAPVAGGAVLSQPSVGLGAQGSLLPGLPLPAPGLVSGLLDGAAPIVNFAPAADHAAASSPAAEASPAAASAEGEPSSRRPVIPGDETAGSSQARVLTGDRREGAARAASVGSVRGLTHEERSSQESEALERSAAAPASADPESETSAGRRFWDQSGGAGALTGTTEASAMADASFRTARPVAPSALGVHARVPASDGAAFDLAGAPLRDAVGSPAPGRAPQAAGAWRASFPGRPSLPEGDAATALSRPGSARPVASALSAASADSAPSGPARLALSVFGPRLSVSLGLVSAPNGALSASLGAVSASPARAIASTEWLERAALLEAVSASQSFMGSASERLAAVSGAREVAPLRPAPGEAAPSRRRGLLLGAPLLLLLPALALLRRGQSA